MMDTLGRGSISMTLYRIGRVCASIKFRCTASDNICIAVPAPIVNWNSSDVFMDKLIVEIQLMR